MDGDRLIAYCPQCGWLKLIPPKTYSGRCKPFWLAENTPDTYYFGETYEGCIGLKETILPKKWYRKEEIYIAEKVPQPMIVTDEKFGQDFPGDPVDTYDDLNVASFPNGLTLGIYEYMWNKYLYAPENKLFNPEHHELLKTWVYDYLVRRGGFNPSANIHTSISCPRCHSTSISTVKQGFGVGKAAAGVVAAGPVGALAGGINANKIYNVCQSCGYKWEPGKR